MVNMCSYIFWLWSLPCMQTFALLLPRVQLGSMEKNCQMDSGGRSQYFPPWGLSHKQNYRVCFIVTAASEEFQKWGRFTNLIAYGSSILGGSKRWLLHSFTLSTTLLLNKCTSFSYLEQGGGIALWDWHELWKWGLKQSQTFSLRVM